IIGRPGLKAIQAVPSTVHGMLKFPTEEGIVTIRSSLLVPAECTSIDTSSPLPIEKKTRPANLTVTLHPNFPDQEAVVGGPLSDKGPEGVFLGYVITPEEIKPCPDKTTERGPADRTRDDPDASLLYKPCITGSGTKLLTDGKTGFIAGLCGKKTSKIFAGTSYHGKEVTAVIEKEGPTWMTKLVNLKEGILPGDEKEAQKLRLKARQALIELGFGENHKAHVHKNPLL
nr:reverse transcriptase domain-containing protein [Tanacetum cinerariifolium]